jgi:hypothetical protein
MKAATITSGIAFLSFIRKKTSQGTWTRIADAKNLTADLTDHTDFR